MTKVRRTKVPNLVCTANVLIDPYDTKSGKARVCRSWAAWSLTMKQGSTKIEAGSCASHLNIMLEELEGTIPNG